MDQDPELNPAVIELDQFYRHPPERVWRALTEPAVLEQWLLQSVGYSAEVGTNFMFVVPTDRPAEIAGEVLECEPVSRLTWNWRDMRSGAPRQWPVTWSLHRHARGTRLVLVQSGFDIDDRRQKMARSGMSRNWRTTLARLGDVLDRF
ncbi:SRPBCC domain-containing protein [Tsukamurella serpentis]